ncbi:hypothetical protein RND81_12G152300 [Saponaria officinalis]|uniref:Uncharacterized protein n=1 Tax=Saponaria officinalis TaxID=3572 RepID=A0AAW1HAT9_SAPOF
MKRPPSTAASNALEFPPPQPPNPRDRKTRELPKLCDCHCCNRRINSTNPKNRIGILRSEWRIVLLCKSCHNLVESSQTCSYCLTRVSSAFYECKKCRRRIHTDCVSKFSFGSSGNSCDEFSVCYDCWIPNLLENEYNRNRIARIGSSKKQLGKNDSEKRKCLADVVDEAHVVAEEKIAMAVESKENVFRKIMAAKKAVELASGALGIVATDNGGEKGDSVVDEDARLAIRLHREMNSSPRISRNSCSLNSHCVNVPRVDGVESRGANEASFSGRGTEVGVDVDGMHMNSSQVRERNESSGVKQEFRNKFGRAQDGKCNGDSKSCVITYVRKGKVSKVVKHKEVDGSLLKMYSRKLSRLAKPEPSQHLCQFVKREGRCSKTYSRRRLHCKNDLANSGIKLENVDLTPNMSLACHEEPRALTNAT